jgi:hypothetical protein
MLSVMTKIKIFLKVYSRMCLEETSNNGNVNRDLVKGLNVYLTRGCLL